MKSLVLRAWSRLALAVCLSVVCSNAAEAQRTGLVASSDPVYMDIDRLSELGVLDSLIIGQRPYSRAEIARIVVLARTQLESGGPALQLSDLTREYALRITERMERRFEEVSDVMSVTGQSSALIDGMSLTVTSTNAERRGFPAPYSSPTEATIDPLAERRLGRPAVRGTTAALEVAHRVELSDWLALQLRERIEYRNPSDKTLNNGVAELLLASARVRYRNIATTVGRQQFTWAQTAGDGLFLASDAPALDQISLTGDHPFFLPGFLDMLGPAQATVILADLGASAHNSHSKLLTYKISIQPSSALELGGEFLNHFGGTGSRSSSLGDRLIDFVPLLDVFRKHNYYDSTQTLEVESDKALGVDGRLRITPLFGILLTGELLIDDFDVHRLGSLLTGSGSQTVGIVVPRIGTPALSLKLHAKHMGILTYTHSQFQSGSTTRGRLLGDELGPDAKSFGAQLSWEPTSFARLELEGRSAIYSNATYRAFYSDDAQTHYVIQKASSVPNELRDIGLASLALRSDEGISLIVRGGGERIRNANFAGARRSRGVLDVSLRVGL